MRFFAWAGTWRAVTLAVFSILFWSGFAHFAHAAEEFVEPERCIGWIGGNLATHIEVSEHGGRDGFTERNSAIYRFHPSSNGAEYSPQQALTCTGFRVPNTNFSSMTAELRVSLAAVAAQDAEDVLVPSYSLDGGQRWQTLQTVVLQGIVTNGTHEGYWNFQIPLAEKQDVKNLQVRFSIARGDTFLPTFVLLDGLSLRVSGEEEADAEPSFFHQLFHPDTTSYIVLKQKSVTSVEFFDPKGRPADLQYIEELTQDGLTLQLQPKAILMPGKYIVRTKTKKFLHTVTEEHSFTVGTASMNTNRSSYTVGDPVSVFMGVVDSQGKTICDASLRLTVTKPDQSTFTLHTDGGGIANSAECGPESLTDLPDYSATFIGEESGEYALLLEIDAKGAVERIQGIVTVGTKEPSFSIERRLPTRINPRAPYVAELFVTSANDFAGTISESVPADFAISGISPAASIVTQGESQRISWNVNWKANTVYKLSYVFDAPDLSPALFFVGPVATSDFTEARMWGIASDEAVRKEKQSMSFESLTLNAEDWAEQKDALVHIPKSEFSAEENVHIKAFTKGYMPDASARIEEIGHIEVEGPAGREDGVLHASEYFRRGDMHIEMLHLVPDAHFRPGQYTVKTTLKSSEGERVVEQQFDWGVAAVNVRRSVLQPGQSTEIHMAVLDDFGRTVCNSEIALTVTDPAGTATDFSSEEGSVLPNPDCRDRSVTNTPDYLAEYTTTIPGTYLIEMEATSVDGPRTAVTTFAVNADPAVSIERTEFPTRIYPIADYPVVASFVPKADIKGTVREFVPASFVISDITNGGEVAMVEGGSVQEIIWEVDWQGGEAYTLGYTFDAPNVSPLLFLLGGIEIRSEDGAPVFAESRQWQIASDATKTWDGDAVSPNWATCSNWNNDTCPAVGDDIVFDGTSHDNSTWDPFIFVTSVSSITATNMSGLITISKSGATVTGDFSHTSTGGVTYTVNLTVGGNYTLTTSGTFTPGTSTLTLTGTGGNTINTNKVHYNITVDPSSAATISVVTNNFSVGNVLSVASGDTLSIGSGRIVTLLVGAGSSLTLDGTISGSGTLIYSSTTTFPTTGTISCNLRLDGTSGNYAVPARTFGGALELYSNSTSARTVTLGTAGSQTITVSGNLDVAANNTANIIVTGATNAPAVNVGGNFDMTGTGSGSERIVTGAGDWTIGGGFDLRGVNLFTATSGNEIILTGINVSVFTDNRAFYDLTFNPASSSLFTFSGGSGVGNTLTVGTNAEVAFSDASDFFDLTNDTGTSLVLNGEISGDGFVYYYTGVTFPSTGAMNSPVYFYPFATNMTIPGRTFGHDVWIEADNGSQQTVTFGTGSGQDIIIDGFLSVDAQSTGDLVIDAATHDTDVLIGSDLEIGNSGAGTEVIQAGAGSWTVSGSVNLTDCQFTIESGHTLVMDGSGGLTTGSTTLENLTLSGAITLANATHTVSGNLSLAGGTITAGTSTISLTGTSNTIVGGGNTLNNLTIDPASTGTITLQTSDLTVSSTLTIGANDTLSISSGRMMKAAALSLGLGSVVSGAGRMTFTGSSFTDADGTISATMRFDATANSQTVIGRSYGGGLELYTSSSTSHRSITLGSAGGQTVAVTGDLSLYADGANDLSVDDGSFDPAVTVSGNLDFLGSGGGSEDLGDLALTVSGNADVAGGTFSGDVNLTMNGTGGNTLNCGGNTFSELTIDPSSAATITAQTADCGVSSALTVATGDTLALASGVNLDLGSSLTFTLNGTVSGAGRLIWTSTSEIPSTGTLSSIVRYDTTGIGQTIRARSYGGDLEVFTEGTSFVSQTVTVGSGTLAIGGDLTLTTDDNEAFTLDCNTNDPTVTIGADIDRTGAGTTPSIGSGSGTWTVSGNVDLTDITWTAESGNTFQMNGTTKTLTSASQIFQNFTVTGGSITTTDATDINDAFSMTAGSFTPSTNANMNVAGDFTLSNGTTFVGPTGSGTLILDGDLTLTDNNASKQNLGNVQIGTSPDTTDLASDTLYFGLTIATGDVLNTNGYEITASALTVNGTLDATDDVETDESTISIAGNVTFNSGATFVQDQSTIVMNAASGTRDLITNGSFSLYNLTINDGGGSLTVEVEDALDVDNNLTITGGTLDTKSGENNAIEVGGSWDNDDTFVSRTATVTMNGASGTKTIDAQGTVASPFYNIVFNDGGGSATYQLTTPMEVTNDLTITGGNLDANSNNIDVGGSWDNDDTFTSGTQTVTFDALAGTETIDADGTGAEAFSSVVFNDNGGSATWQLTTSMDVNGNFTVNGGTFDFNGSNTLFVGGNLTNNDSILESTGTLQMDAASGTATIDAAEAISDSVSDWNNIIFNDGGGSASFKTTYPLDANGNFTITGGTLDMEGPTTWYLTSSTEQAADFTMRLDNTDPAGSADTSSSCSDGGSPAEGQCIITPGSENTVFDALPSAISEAGWMLNNGNPLNGTFAAGDWSADVTINYTMGSCSYGIRRISGRLWKVTEDLASATAISNWSSTATVNTGLHDYTFSFPSVAETTLNNETLYVEFALRLNSSSCGGSDPSTFAFHVNEGGDQQQITSTAFTPQINVGGNWDNDDTFLAQGGLVVMDAASGTKTIDADGTGTDAFSDLTLNDGGGSATYQLSTAADIDDDLTITGGTFDANSNNINVGGDWANSDTFTAGTNTVTLDGAARQAISGTLTGGSAFSTLAITNTSGSFSGCSDSFTPGVDFAASATATNYTITTPDVKVEYNSGSTYTFTNINWDGSPTGPDIVFRNSDLLSGTWLLNVSGTQTAVKFVNVARSDASSGNDIDATHVSNTDCGNNTGWSFDAIVFSISDTSVGFGTLLSTAARWATGDATGSSSDTAAHTLSIRTSAASGYTITYYGATLASGANAIDVADINGDADGTPGTEQFALSVSTNGNASIPTDYQKSSDNYRFIEDASTPLASETGPTATETISVFYIGNISPITPPGAYSTSITYIATGTF